MTKANFAGYIDIVSGTTYNDYSEGTVWRCIFVEYITKDICRTTWECINVTNRPNKQIDMPENKCFELA